MLTLVLVKLVGSPFVLSSTVVPTHHISLICLPLSACHQDILESPHQELLLHPVIKEWADCKW